ncbi:MAG TPA: cytochrome c oxidase assembly protein [Acidiferrobacteraceae bacterium]|nr:cytochrome c oxidase assembly protein [Acidiferrobacteraceae bacterium]
MVGANQRTLRKLLLVAVAMFGFGYVLVPLYDVFCDVTGIRFNTQAKQENTAAAQGLVVDKTRWVTVEFTGNAMQGLPWEFYALKKKVRLHPGQTTVVKYFARNRADEAIVGQAVPSVAPPRATKHLKKAECFCFTQQRLAAGESKEMVVQFVIDPALPKEVDIITLSYAFFNADRVSANKYGGSAAPESHEHHGSHKKVTTNING